MCFLCFFFFLGGAERELCVFYCFLVLMNFDLLWFFGFGFSQICGLSIDFFSYFVFSNFAETAERIEKTWIEEHC